jgi:FkbM family methyltransferase
VQGSRHYVISCDEVRRDLAPDDVAEVLNGPPIEPDFAIFRYFDQPSETVLDIGANIGMAAASIFNSGCRAAVVSFEPNPWHHPSLLRIKKRMRGRFDMLPTGLGVPRGQLRFVTPVIEGKAESTLSTADILGELDWGIPENLVSYLMNEPWNVAEPRIQFCESDWQIDTLDAAVAQARLDVSLERIAAIKLDVEGYEANVIAGGHQVLARHRPLLMVEGANRVPGGRPPAQGTRLPLCGFPRRSIGPDAPAVHPSERILPPP